MNFFYFLINELKRKKDIMFVMFFLILNYLNIVCIAHLCTFMRTNIYRTKHICFQEKLKCLMANFSSKEEAIYFFYFLIDFFFVLINLLKRKTLLIFNKNK
jgi:hypothetical protein